MEALIHHYTKACEFEGWIMWCHGLFQGMVLEETPKN
jgi:hypothetical protein